MEKVKLPFFNGKQEDFSEFHCQFRELCRGERYTPVLEMAQLKLKLPKEALTAIAGLRCPDEAWARLEELYGDQEIAILAALKGLREFKPTKAAAHKQVLEIAAAVQKCQTELKNVSALHELLGDREAIACILLTLPSTVRDKWYDRKVPEDTRKKGEFLLTWLEEQRLNAIRVRQDTMAAKMRAPTAPSTKPSHAQESTDKGLLSNSLHALGSGSSQPKAGAGNQQAGDGGASKDKMARIKVKNAQDAQRVADRRRQNLETCKMDKCPICDQRHLYKRSWTSTTPPPPPREGQAVVYTPHHLPQVPGADVR